MRAEDKSKKGYRDMFIFVKTEILRVPADPRFQGGRMVKEYIAKRIIYALITLYVVTTLNFVFFQVLSPIDPITMYLGPRGGSIITPEKKQEMVARFGLNDSLSARYVRYTVNTFTFKFGFSLKTGLPVAYELSMRIGPTVLLGGLALVITPILGVLLGAMAASRRGSKIDLLAIAGGLFAWGVPSFFVQIIVLLVFGVILGWFPTVGFVDVPAPVWPSFEFIAQVAAHLALPLAALVVHGIGFFSLYTRNMMLDTFTEDYIVTARAKGLKERTVVYKHALRAVLPPVFTMFVIYLPSVLWFVMMAEIVFAWPGIGNWFFVAAIEGDFPTVQAIVFLFAIIIIVGNFVTDLLYMYLDPRIRVGRKG